MLDPESQGQLRREILDCAVGDKHLLEQLRAEIQPLKNQVRRIQPRGSTAISLVATDGGNNALQFDPFLVQLVRVVDSSNNNYCLEAVSPTTDIARLSRRQFDQAGTPKTPLGNLMAALGVEYLPELSPMIPRPDRDRPVSPSWVQVYRELVEWSVLFALVREKDFGTDTLIVVDGFLRSKIFSRDLFSRMLHLLGLAIDAQYQQSRRRIYLAGIAKHSKVLARYRLAMALEGVMTTDYPAYVEIPRELEEKAYIWNEYARGDDRAEQGGEAIKFVGGKMFFVKFGSHKRDPIWPVDIFIPQLLEAQTIFGHMLSDAINGFPVPCYPQSLQRAHENAALVDFDFEILQDEIFEGIRHMLAEEAPVLDAFRLQESDPSRLRYQ
jgi:hypothetical protein